MINIITSNKISGNNIDQKDLPFVIVQLQTVQQFPFDQLKYKYLFKIYYQKNIKIDKSDYVTSGNYEYQYIPSLSIKEVLSNIIDNYSQITDNDKPTIITSCIDYKLNNFITKYLKKSNIDCLNLYTYMKTTNGSNLVNIIKTNINSEYVYDTDPVEFAYCVYYTFNGDVSI